jgi:hypothetical protein
MDMITVYLTGALVLIGLWALRVPHEDVRMVFILAVIWPVSILAIVVFMIIDATGWNVDFAKGTKMFNFRKGTNPQITGFAFTFLFQEFQFFKARKLVDKQ